VIKGIVSRVGAQKLDIVAHSMGGRGVVQALTSLACTPPPAPLIDELILLAPDIDTDLFGHDLPLLKKAANRVTIYVSENDKALALSHEVHGYPRLGEAGEHLAVLEGIDTIDISPAGRRRMSGHIYHIFNPAVVNDLRQLLATGNPPAQRSGLIRAERNGMLYWRIQPADSSSDIEDNGH
jgi:esterase/lipase superfamily enzyme